ncbi:TPA: DUF106 domain-containing protein [Candidatus Bathyarchaeota archaeon]|nr:DUF106 domain-containing protein [Candidatus Bathyarchaeota archaeon]
MVAFIDELFRHITSALQPYSSIPNSTLLILAVAASLSLTSTLSNRLLVDIERMKRVMKEVSAWRKEFEEAKKSKNKQLLSKVMKKQQAIMRLQGKMMWDRMKVSFIFLLPFWIVFIILSRFYGTQPVALSPFSIPILLSGRVDEAYGAIQLSFVSWYIICSFGVSLPLSRILGINPED